MGSQEFGQFDISRRTVLRAALAGGATLALPPLLSACGEGSGGGSGSGSSRLTVGTALDIVNFDPYSQSISSLILLRNLNGWLLNYDEQLEPQPDALESFEISADRTSVALRIRDDVVFTTGKTMTVDDVVFAFERAADPETGFNLANAMSIVSDVKATSDSEVVLTFHQPTASSLITDLLVGQPVIDMDKNSSEALASEPASAGPYRLAEWRQGESLTLEANPDWYRGEAATGEVVLQIFNSPTALVSALESDAIDVAAYLPPNDAARIADDYTMLEGFPGAAIQLLRVSTLTEPFADQTVRQALQRSVNRQRIVDEVMFGFGGPANLPWGPDNPANDPAFAEQTEFNLEEAKRLIDSTAARSGTAMVSGADPVSLQVMQIIQADLESIGFALEIEQADQATFESRLVEGDFGVALGQMGGGQLSAPRVVQNSLLRVSNNPLWAGGQPPAEYAGGMAALVTEEDEAAQQSAYDQVNGALVDQSWAIATYYVPTLFASKPDVHDVKRDHQNALVLADATS